jgi:hypothetical protein
MKIRDISYGDLTTMRDHYAHIKEGAERAIAYIEALPNANDETTTLKSHQSNIEFWDVRIKKILNSYEEEEK